jgi:hypothetical protein
MNRQQPTSRIWAILGEQSSGKSTIVAGLSSHSSGGPVTFRDVLTRGGGFLRILAFRQSLQEAKITPDKLLIKISKKCVELERAGITPSFVNVLIALRLQPARGCPGGASYLNELTRAGGKVEALVVLNYEDRYENYHDFGAPVCCITDTESYLRKEHHRGWLIGQVRNHFGWA